MNDCTSGACEAFGLVKPIGSVIVYLTVVADFALHLTLLLTQHIE